MKVLFLTHRLPYPPNRGDRIRAYHILQTLRRRARIDLVSLVHDAEEASNVDALRELADTIHLAPVPRLRNWMAGAYSLTMTRPLTHALLDSPAVLPALDRIVAERRPDVVLAYCSGMARFALDPPLAGFPLIIDLVDVDSLKWKALAGSASPPIRWIYSREAKCLSRFEARAARRAFATLVVNDREQAALTAIVPDARIEIVPNGVDYERLRPSSEPAAAPNVVFCGVMNYAPNVEAATWLAREVWPLVLHRSGAARLTLVGSHPTPALRRLAVADSSIEVTGEVSDVRPYLWNAAVAVAPLQTARGVQNKVLEAVAAGLPVIITPAVADGLPSEVLPACRVADGPAAFADAIVQSLSLQPRERRAMTERIDLSVLSWERQLEGLGDLVQAAACVADVRQ